VKSSKVDRSSVYKNSRVITGMFFRGHDPRRSKSGAFELDRRQVAPGFTDVRRGAASEGYVCWDVMPQLHGPEVL